MSDRPLSVSPLLRVVLVPALAACGLQARQEKPAKLQQMSLEELLNLKVTVASRTETTVLEAPSVVTVYTAEDLRRMGARDLRDVLRQVPGFEVGVRAQLGYPEIGVRGVMTDNSEKVRVLIDGLAVNENLEGSGTILFGNMALDNVQQIEIIRGPGSALYGTNAFVGVVSIITKDAASSGGATTVSAKGGSFNTREGSVLTGWSGSKLRVSAYLHYLDTDGPNSPIAEDALNSRYTSGINSAVSLAGGPLGYTHEAERRLSTQIKLDYQGLYLNALLVNTHKGPYLGTLFAVNDHSDAHPYQVQGTLGYTFRPGDAWTVEPRIYVLRYKADNFWNDAPEGVTLSTPGGPVTFPYGLYEINRATQQTRGAEVKATWSLSAQQKIILGGGMEEDRIYQIENASNTPGTGPEGLFPTPPIIKKTPIRTIGSAFLQDQWTPVPDLTLTGGLRMDHYNDAGTSVVPRLAAVYRVNPKVYVKAMYGEAFRAPTFVESYLDISNGAIQVRGREANRPERIRTGEFEGGYRFASWGHWRLVLFQNRIHDLLRLVPAAGALEYQNIPDLTVVKGLESEWTFTFTETWSGHVTYSVQSGRNEATQQHLVGMANWRATAGVNAALSDRWNLNASLLAIGPRQRDVGDPRPELKGDLDMDAAVIFVIRPGLEAQLTAHNLFDADRRYANPNTATPIPGDSPAGGRDVQLGLRWRF